jgi:hypothetical protein
VDAPVSTSRSVTWAPSVPLSSPMTSVPSSTRADGNERRWSSSTGSTWSCGTEAGAVGLRTALCSRVGKLVGFAWPAAVSVGPTHCFHSTSTPPARIARSNPQARNSSIVRVLIEAARGSPDRAGRRSTTTTSIPWRASAMAVVSPAGPAPTTSTGGLVAGQVAAVRTISAPHSSDMLSFAGQRVFRESHCQGKC